MPGLSSSSLSSVSEKRSGRKVQEQAGWQIRRLLSVTLSVLTELGVLVSDTAWGRLMSPFLLVEEDDLCLLTSLLEENEAALPCSSEENNKSLPLEDGDPDEFDELFDADGDGESYTEEADSGEEGKTGNQEEGLAALFGDVEDLTDDEVPSSQVENSAPPAPAPSREKTNQELQGNPDHDGLLSPIYSGESG